MSKYLMDQIEETENIHVWPNSQIQEARGTERLEKLVISREGGDKTETVDASALFIFIGAVPQTEWLKDVVDRDDHGFILSGPDAANGSGHQGSQRAMLETSVPGVFVAGDVRHGGIKRVASAVGEGSMAVMFVHRYLSQV
jgi:thioredoxin reductase (NADPH)